MPRKPKPITVSAAKDRLGELKAMRRILAERVDDESTPTRDLSPLVLRLKEVSVEIEEIEIRDASEAKSALALVKDDTSWDQGAI
ncbi:hypothetical protein ACTXM8_10365 [Brachybacterium alimentarium]|uniref:hypothetical protein n=1 Tax=Brachybacterium alimentarium TaxID=47845 RepID=UPI003FCFCA68